MFRALRIASLALIAAALAIAPARAVGPVDVEITALGWMSDTDVNGVKESSEAPAARAEVWIVDRFGVSLGYFAPRPGGDLDGFDLTYTNLDLKYRFLSVSRNNFFAVGAGWEQIDPKVNGVSKVQGARLAAEGRVGIVKILYFYGRAGYLPKLDDLEIDGTTFTDGKGWDAEAGLQIKPFAFVQFFFGFRTDSLGYRSPEGDLDVKNSGPVVGVGVNF